MKTSVIDTIFFTGMRVLHKKFPACFISGKIPSTCFSPKTDRKGKMKPPPSLTQNIGVDWYDSMCILFKILVFVILLLWIAINKGSAQIALQSSPCNSPFGYSHNKCKKTCTFTFKVSRLLLIWDYQKQMLLKGALLGVQKTFQGFQLQGP